MPNGRPHILIADSNSSDSIEARSILSMFNYEVSVATTIEQALTMAGKHQFDAVLVSIELQGSGFALSQDLRELPGNSDVPIAFSTRSESDNALLMEAQFYGGLFLIHKPYNESQLLAQLSTMVRIKQLQDELKNKMTELDRLASTDPLTGLYNRRFFYQRMEEEISRASRSMSPISLVYLDIDLFKAINDTYGHQAGDTVLKQVARIMTRLLRKSDVLGRIGGEEFLILLPDTDGPGSQVIADRLCKRVENTPFLYKDDSIDVTVSLGVYCSPDPVAIGVDELVSRADAALYEAKQSGRNRVVYHPPPQHHSSVKP